MKMNTGIYRGLLLVAAGLALAASAARADTINLLLNPAFWTAAPGDVVSFDATVSAPESNDDWVFMNGDTATVDAPLILDDSPFFANFPLWLDNGQSWEDTLFTVTVPLGTPDGLYTGNFEIDGGSDANSYDYLTNAAFNVQVGQSESIPEPSTFLLAGAVLLMLAHHQKTAP